MDGRLLDENPSSDMEGMSQGKAQDHEMQFTMGLVDSEENEYSISATIINGEARSVALTDPNGYQTVFPNNILGQLIAGLGTQEQMVRGEIARNNAAQFMSPQMGANTPMVNRFR